MKRPKPFITAASLAIIVTVGTMVPASGTLMSPNIAVDINPTIMGIQSTPTVTQGTTFTVNLVGEYLVAGGQFDSAVARILFNNAMTLLPVLSPMAPTSPVPGLLAGTSPGVADAFGPNPMVGPGTPLNSGLPEPPLPGFAPSTAAAGYLSYAGPFMPDPVLPTPILSMTFTANAPGMSTLLPNASMFGGGGDAVPSLEGAITLNGLPINTILSLRGQPIFTDNIAGSVTVLAPPNLPESGSTLAMLGLVTAGPVGARRRRS